MTGVGPSFWEQHQERFRFPDCELELAAGSLADHFQIQSRKERPPQWVTPPDTPEPRIYRVSFPRAYGSIGCPVGGCERQETMCTNLWIHFMHRHVCDMIVIMEEGNRPHPRCPDCDMFVS